MHSERLDQNVLTTFSTLSHDNHQLVIIKNSYKLYKQEKQLFPEGILSYRFRPSNVTHSPHIKWQTVFFTALFWFRFCSKARYDVFNLWILEITDEHWVSYFSYVARLAVSSCFESWALLSWPLKSSNLQETYKTKAEQKHRDISTEFGHDVTNGPKCVLCGMTDPGKRNGTSRESSNCYASLTFWWDSMVLTKQKQLQVALKGILLPLPWELSIHFKHDKEAAIKTLTIHTTLAQSSLP